MVIFTLKTPQNLQNPSKKPQNLKKNQNPPKTFKTPKKNPKPLKPSQSLKHRKIIDPDDLGK